MTTTIDPESVAIGRAVRGAFAAAGLSLADASVETGIALSTLSRRVNGTLPFTFPELVRIASVCGLRVSDLTLSAERIIGSAA
jgi:hypothetical protein